MKRRGKLGISRRAYVYLEAGLTSRGRKMPFIPRVTELACAAGSAPRLPDPEGWLRWFAPSL